MNSSPRSAGAGNSSSPSGTVPTIYSPTLVRDFGENSRSASRRLVNDGSVEHQSPVVKTHFIDEYDPTDNAYISRYLLVTHFPDGTPEGGELEGFMAKTKNVSAMALLRLLVFLLTPSSVWSLQLGCPA